MRAAREVIEQHGVKAYSVRTLADQVGADPSAVYRYFPSLDSVLSAVVDDLFMGIEFPATGTPRERVEALLVSVHERFYAHPNLVPLLLAAGADRQTSVPIEAAGLALLEELGLRGEQLALCQRLLESYVIGTHAFDLGGAPSHLESRRMRMRQVDHPDIDATLRDLAAVDDINRRAFRTGLTVLLDYCETLAASGR
ncbi:MAG: TetR/AcrR family transcriptional regulator [Ilumatobacteraceae bacterium]